jgi:hypothetical protein
MEIYHIFEGVVDGHWRWAGPMAQGRVARVEMEKKDSELEVNWK